MEVSYLKMWMENLILEEINRDQLASVSKTLNIDEEILRAWVNEVDNTINKSYAVWLLRGLKNNDFRLEDKQRVFTAIHEHLRLRISRLIEDIMRYPTLHDLEAAVEPLAKTGSKRQGYSGVDPTTLPGVTVLDERPDMTFFKVSNANSLAKIGEGTKWCTRLSYENSTRMAKRYIDQYSYIIVGYKDGKPFIQYNPDYSQVMDVNDRNFTKNTDNIDPSSLELPAPDFLKHPLPTLAKAPKIKYIRPVEPKEKNDKLSPQQQSLKNWMAYTQQQNPEWNKFIIPRGSRTASTKGKDLDYERRVANSIKKTKNHEFFLRMMEGFRDYFRNELKPGERATIIEKALLEKDFNDIKQNFGVTQRRPGVRDKRAGINGLYIITDYVKNKIRGHWPEFEKKLQDDTYNSVYYYHVTGLNPDYVTNPMTRDIVLFNKAIEGKNPILKTPTFEGLLKNFLLRARKELKHGAFQQTVNYVLKPYMEYTGRSFKDIMGQGVSPRKYNVANLPSED